MDDGWMVGLAIGACVGALAAKPMPVVVGVVIVGAAFALGRQVLLVVGVGLLASALAAAAWSGLRSSPLGGTVQARGAVGLDRKVVGGAPRVDARVGHRRVQLTARGDVGRAIERHLAGES